MNNKGFTLIELIMMITILAMIALLSTPNIIKLIEKNKVDNYNSTIDSIFEATELYVSNNRYNLTFNKTCAPTDTNDIYTTISLKNLIDSKDITTPVKNPCTDEEIPITTQIKVSLNCETKIFSYAIDYTSNTTLLTITDITDTNGKIIEGKTCSDLY